ncbi:MAG: hypothetical protein H8E38_02570 [SAR324 cluster bacterium]|nr:hypothetical protein [SAR324 cluster bacterium]
MKTEIENNLQSSAEENASLQVKIRQQSESIRMLQEQLDAAEMQIKAARGEEEVLRQEVHHRVKNNLQIISSILSLYTGNIADPNIEAVLKNTHSRVATISLIHKQLYDSSSLAEIDMQEYVNSQIKDILSIYPIRSPKIVLKLELEPVVLDVDRAIHCALLINELVVNSIWHAFRGRERGVLQISLAEKANDKLRLLVADDGIGLPVEIDLSQTKSIGLRMAYNFILRLQGELALSRDNGTSYQIDFPKHNF